MNDTRNTGSSLHDFDMLARALFEIGVIKFGEFKLKSGIMSPFYFDMRCVISRPDILRAMAGLYVETCSGLAFERIAGVPFTGLPIATAVSLEAGYPMVFGRRDSKGYGVARRIEGAFEPGESVLIIDDVITDGRSKIEYIDIFTNNGLLVGDIVVFLDREQGGTENMRRHGMRLHAVCTISRLLRSLRASDCIDDEQFETVSEFIAKR